MSKQMHQRVMIKLSGESLSDHQESGVSAPVLKALCSDLIALQKTGLQMALVLGGGNLWRYRDNKELPLSRPTSDALGMMATIMNARLLQDALREMGAMAHALAPHGEFYFVEPYTPGRGQELLNRGSIVICGGGTGNPYFTTDTAAALRALELNCEVLLKATKVDGVYDSDPEKNPSAQRFEKISYSEVLQRGLEVMDLTAITLCKENNLPVRVFNGVKPGALREAILSGAEGTLIHP
jgi:uridylate kinase